ncbi:sodium/bile acid cotransporter 7-like isoform X3 [Formica exsecta]|uniref:sodium/bile acid cotransporter 7-like isoform X3 n=1 Tax=Formica exsecta TaxID=72781 RepID=UPI0011449140|nr:sodium/bile acid cotransporter 7-like isoform X3 [Formica exsecta]
MMKFLVQIFHITIFYTFCFQRFSFHACFFRYISKYLKMCIKSTHINLQPRKKTNLLYRYGYVLLMLACMIFASIQPHIGGTNGIINARIGTYLLTYAKVNVWLLKGMEVLYCMPPPFSTGLALCRLAQADLPTSVITTLVSHFGGLFLSPILLYLMLGMFTPPLVGINFKETIYSTLIPLGMGIMLRSFILKDKYLNINTGWFSQGLLLTIAYHWFCDAVLADASSLQAVDILFCVLITCVGQLLLSSLCWILCSQWLPRNILLAALFTSTHKSVGLGGWILRGAYHGSVHGPAVNLPLTILPVAQLLLGSLLASWLAP